MEKSIENLLNGFPEEYIILLEVNSDNALRVVLGTTKVLTEQDYGGIVLSASRPYANLVSLYKRVGINAKKLFIIDCTPNTNDSMKGNSNVSYVNSYSLTNVSIELNRIIESTKNKKFVLVDSIPSMLIHNKTVALERFIHGLLTKMRIDGINVILISMEDFTGKEIMAEISQLCDKVVKI